MSAQDKQRYSADVDQDLRSARLNAAAAAKRALSPDQRNTLEHIQSLIQQSEDLRKTDLVAAKGMSSKAAVLARDLAAATSK